MKLLRASCLAAYVRARLRIVVHRAGDLIRPDRRPVLESCDRNADSIRSEPCSAGDVQGVAVGPDFSHSVPMADYSGRVVPMRSDSPPSGRSARNAQNALTQTSPLQYYPPEQRSLTHALPPCCVATPQWSVRAVLRTIASHRTLTAAAADLRERTQRRCLRLRQHRSLQRLRRFDARPHPAGFGFSDFEARLDDLDRHAPADIGGPHLYERFSCSAVLHGSRELSAPLRSRG